MKKPKKEILQAGSGGKAKPKALRLPASPLIVLHGKREILVYDCRKILRYERNEILLLCGKGQVLLQGKDLCFVSFSMGDVTIRGELSALSFPTGERG